MGKLSTAADIYPKTSKIRPRQAQAIVYLWYFYFSHVLMVCKCKSPTPPTLSKYSSLMLTEIGVFCGLYCSVISVSFIFSGFCAVSHNLSWQEYKSDSYAQLCNTFFLQALSNSYVVNYLVTTSTSWVKIFKVTLTWVNVFATLLPSAPGPVLLFAFLAWMLVFTLTCYCTLFRLYSFISTWWKVHIGSGI